MTHTWEILVLTKTLALCALLLPSLLAAQDTDIPEALLKGSKLVGGSASISQQRTDDNKVTFISLNPELLAFVADGFAVGGRVGLSRQSSDGGSSTGWSIGPAMRAFFAARDSRMLPYIGLSVLFGRTESKSFGTSATTTQRVLDGALGITRLLGDQVGLDAELFYTHTRFDRKFAPPIGGPSTTNFSTFGVRFGFSAFLLQR